MPIRFPFRKATGGDPLDVNQVNAADKGFQKTTTTGVTPVDVKDPAEYKLSEINDSGVYLPPSPQEKQNPFWSMSRTSTSSNQRSIRSLATTDNEPFNISRESFDSYRRSFDISARSPISELDHVRGSLDSRRAMPTRPPRASFQERHIDRPTYPEEGFEDVGLNDDAQPKKRGLFARFGDNIGSSSSNENASPSGGDGRPSSSHRGFSLIPGRKRGQSGVGNELKSIPKDGSSTPNGSATPVRVE